MGWRNRGYCSNWYKPGFNARNDPCGEHHIDYGWYVTDDDWTPIDGPYDSYDSAMNATPHNERDGQNPREVRWRSLYLARQEKTGDLLVVDGGGNIQMVVKLYPDEDGSEMLCAGGCNEYSAAYDLHTEAEIVERWRKQFARHKLNGSPKGERDYPWWDHNRFISDLSTLPTREEAVAVWEEKQAEDRMLRSKHPRFFHLQIPDELKSGAE